MHPRDILLGAQAAAGLLPVCDHYSGVEARMRKSLQLQAEMSEEFGACVFDVTLDCEDGAPVGGEAEHALLVTELVMSAPDGARVGARVHPVDHPAFEADMDVIARDAGQRLTHIMIPKVESVDDVVRAEKALLAAYPSGLPLQVLIESPGAVQRAFDIAAHPRVQSLSFGLMDFVSAHAGAIPAEGMGIEGQFTHPLVRRAKLEIASAAHAFGKVPSHCVVTEFKDEAALRGAATVRRASSATRACGVFTRARFVRFWRRSRPMSGRSMPPARFCWRRKPPGGRRSATRAPCTTAPAIAISGKCWSARTPLAAPCRLRRRHGFDLTGMP